MTVLIPKIDADVQAPVEKSCNCCDIITCNFFCCTKRAKTPSPKTNETDNKTNEISLQTIKGDDIGIKTIKNKPSKSK